MPEPAPTPPRRGRGRPAGGSQSRETILAAARHRFAVDGYAAASIRRIAADAGVDPALVMRAHGSKDALFAAAMAVPEQGTLALARALDAPRDQVGQYLVRAFLELWVDPVTSAPLMATFRSAVTNEQAAAALRAFVRIRLVEQFEPRFPDLPDLPLRVTLVSTSLVGVIVGRQIVQIEALTTASIDSIAALLAPAVQQILFSEDIAR